MLHRTSVDVLFLQKMRVFGKVQMLFGWFSNPSINDLGRLIAVPFLYDIGKNSFFIVLAIFQQKLALDLLSLLELLPVNDDPRTYLPVPHPHCISLPV